jgi:hypothetical protein
METSLHQAYLTKIKDQAKGDPIVDFILKTSDSSTGVLSGTPAFNPLISRPSSDPLSEYSVREERTVDTTQNTSSLSTGVLLASPTLNFQVVPRPDMINSLFQRFTSPLPCNGFLVRLHG